MPLVIPAPLQRYVQQPYLLPDRLLRLFRCWLLNRHPSISLASDAYLARTAQLQMSTGLFQTGGTIKVASNCSLLDGVLVIPWGGSIEIEENVYIGPYTVLNGHGGLKIGRNTLIAGHTFIIAANHGFEDSTKLIALQPTTKLGITIGEDVWIGCGVQVLDGVTIGRGCVVGAGAVVNKSLPDYAIAVGVPAKIIRYRTDEQKPPALEQG